MSLPWRCNYSYNCFSKPFTRYGMEILKGGSLVAFIANYTYVFTLRFFCVFYKYLATIVNRRGAIPGMLNYGSMPQTFQAGQLKRAATDLGGSVATLPLHSRVQMKRLNKESNDKEWISYPVFWTRRNPYSLSDFHSFQEKR